MYKGLSILAIIPARGGSKRLPRKNVLDLNGQPLIVWSIKAAKKSHYIDEIIVTTDDDEILQIAESHGVKTVRRPADLASDTATTFDAINHTIDNTPMYDYVMLLQPTSPLRNENHIDQAIELLVNKSADAVISVCETEHSPLWCNTLPQSKNLKNFINDDVKDKRSQDLDTYYRLNGAIYLCKTKKLLKSKSFFLKTNIFALVMNKNSSVDIDDFSDFALCQFLLQRKS